jgi:hypothetical protein
LPNLIGVKIHDYGIAYKSGWDAALSRDAWTPVERLPEVDPNTDLLWRNRIDGAVSIHSYSGSSEMVMARYSHWMPIPPYEQER